MKNKTMSIIVVLVISLLFVMACEVRATSDNPITLNLTTGDTTTTTNVVENNIVENTNTRPNTEVANNIDEAKFIMDRLHDTGVDEVHITKDVCIEAEEYAYYSKLNKESKEVLQNYRFA